MLPPAPAHLILVALAAVFAGALVQGSVGFGSALIAAPVLALIDTRMVPGTPLCLGLCLAVAMTHRERHALQLGKLWWALVGRVPGMLLGLLALKLLSLAGLRLAFAALVLAAVLLSLRGARVTVRRVTLLCAGAISGVMGTVASIGGPPIALLHQSESGPRLRANLAFYFTIGSAMSLVGVTAIGRFGWHEVAWSVLLLPAVLAGFAASSRASRFLDAGRTRPAVLLISTISATLLLAREALHL